MSIERGPSESENQNTFYERLLNSEDEKMREAAVEIFNYITVEGAIKKYAENNPDMQLKITKIIKEYAENRRKNKTKENIALRKKAEKEIEEIMDEAFDNDHL